MEAGGKVAVFRHCGRRIVVAHSPKRAAKGKKDRQRGVKRLLDKLNKSGKPKSLLPKGMGRFLRMRGEGRWEVAPDKIAEAARWDGLRGAATNVRGPSCGSATAACGGWSTAFASTSTT